MKLFNKKQKDDKLDTSRGIPITAYWGHDDRIWIYPEDILESLKGYMVTHPDFKNKVKELFN